MSARRLYELTDDAQGDVEDIEAYILSYRDEEFLDRFLDQLIACFEDLCERPLAHPVYQFPEGFEPEREYRSVNVYNFKVFYRVDEDRGRVLVYRIRHRASDFTRVLR